MVPQRVLEQLRLVVRQSLRACLVYKVVELVRGAGGVEAQRRRKVGVVGVLGLGSEVASEGV